MLTCLGSKAIVRTSHCLDGEIGKLPAGHPGPVVRHKVAAVIVSRGALVLSIVSNSSLSGSAWTSSSTAAAPARATVSEGLKNLRASISELAWRLLFLRGYSLDVVHVDSTD